MLPIFSSPRFAECEQRALVLRALGIEHALVNDANMHVLLVAEADAPQAREQLRIYDEENRALSAPQPLHLHEHAWRGSIVFAIVLLTVAYCTGHGLGSFDWIGAGALTRDAVHRGEVWRAITALTLHADLEHLIGNLAFGIPYGFFAAQLLGTGRAWASILFAAALANVVESALMDAQHVTIGASTAVFATLALVAAYSTQVTTPGVTGWARRWSPWIAAIVLLAMTGTAGEHTDVLAHVMGFAGGALLGLFQARMPARWLEARATQLASGGIALAAVIGAWVWAIASR
jgi:membrane associated rhomboid family serine protease